MRQELNERLQWVRISTAKPDKPGKYITWYDSGDFGLATYSGKRFYPVGRKPSGKITHWAWR